MRIEIPTTQVAEQKENLLENCESIDSKFQNPNNNFDDAYKNLKETGSLS